MIALIGLDFQKTEKLKMTAITFSLDLERIRDNGQVTHHIYLYDLFDS